MTQPEQYPHIPTPLIEWLEETYPLTVPPPDIPERKLWMGFGRRRLVEELRAIHDEQGGEGEALLGGHRVQFPEGAEDSGSAPSPASGP